MKHEIMPSLDPGRGGFLSERWGPILQILNAQCKILDLFTLNYHVHSKGKAKNEKERIFYEQNVLLSPEKAFKLCCLTIEQGSSELWRNERKKRITGSKV